MRPLAAILAAAAVLLAGCVGGDVTPSGTSDDLKDDVFGSIRSLLVDVPCEAAFTQGQTTDNLKRLTNLVYDGTTHGEIDAHGDWILNARYQAGGFVVVSIHDPLNPVDVATWATEESRTTYDVKFTPDGRHAVVGFGDRIALVDVTPVTESDLTFQEIADRGVTPELVSEWEYPDMRTFSNMHMLYTHEIGGTDYVFLAPNDDTGVWILEVAGEEAGKHLEYVTNVGEPLGGGPLGPHDMYVHDDEFLDVPVLYVANGFEGWLAWDVSDPANPDLLAVVPNYVLGQGYTHSITALDVDGRRIVATVGEVGANTLKIYDATDFTAPIMLAEWWADLVNPASPQHNLQFVDGYLFVGHYTHGVYVFDLNGLGSLPLLDSLTLSPVAQYVPADVVQPDALGFGNVWDVVVHNGLVYVNDMEHGTDVVGFGCFEAGVPELSGRG